MWSLKEVKTIPTLLTEEFEEGDRVVIEYTRSGDSDTYMVVGELTDIVDVDDGKIIQAELSAELSDVFALDMSYNRLGFFSDGVKNNIVEMVGFIERVYKSVEDAENDDIKASSYLSDELINEIKYE